MRAAVVLVVATASALAAGQMARTLGEREAAPAPQAAAMLEAAPPPPEPQAGGRASLRKAADGHFWADARVEGRPVRFLVDTGASTVALAPADAKRLGIDLRKLAFDRPVSTASGGTMAATVTLDSVSVAGTRVENVEAMVIKDGLDVSLLGMTYLGRLSRFEATPDALILRR